MADVKSFRDLIVWQRAMDLVKYVYAITVNFPLIEKYGLTDQIRRSAVSVPSNIAEGYGRGSKNDYVRFLQIARGSLFELETQIEIAFLLKYLKDKEYANIFDQSIEIEKMLNSLIKKLTNFDKETSIRHKA
jgi:four helix bundle protein